MKKIVFILVTCSLLFACGSTKKTTSETTAELKSLRQKDSLSQLSISQLNNTIEILSVEKSKLETKLKEKTASETNTNTEITLKPEIDPATGKFKPSEYNEVENGVTKKSISITGNGEVVIKSNTKNSQEKETTRNETYEKEFQEKFQAQQKEYNQQLEVKINEIENLKARIKNKEVEKKSSGSSFWLGFKIGVASIVIIFIICWLLNRKYNLLSKIKNQIT